MRKPAIYAVVQSLGDHAPEWVIRAVYQRPLFARMARWVLTRVAPAEPQIVVVRSGLARGCRMRVSLKEEKFYWSGVHEAQLQRLAERIIRPGWTVFDIGAHVGFLTLAFARLVGPNGRVVAFEPAPDNYDRLVENVALNALSWVTAERLGVSDSSGREGFLMLASTTTGRLSSQRRPFDVQDAQFDVDVVTVDEYVATRGEYAPDLLKIDVEGAEASVLRGARNLLRTHAPIILIETHGADASGDVWDALEPLGYHLFRLTNGTGSPPSEEGVLAHSREEFVREGTGWFALGLPPSRGG